MASNGSSARLSKACLFDLIWFFFRLCSQLLCFLFLLFRPLRAFWAPNRRFCLCRVFFVAANSVQFHIHVRARMRRTKKFSENFSIFHLNLRAGVPFFRVPKRVQWEKRQGKETSARKKQIKIINIIFCTRNRFIGSCTERRGDGWNGASHFRTSEPIEII